MRRLARGRRVRSVVGERPLGRWCLPLSSPHCDQQRKGELADLDNGYVDRGVSRALASSTRASPSSPSHPAEAASRDPISVLLANTFGV